MILTKKYRLIYDDKTIRKMGEYSLKSVTTIQTNDITKAEHFDTEAEMQRFVEENNLIEPEIEEM